MSGPMIALIPLALMVLLAAPFWRKGLASRLDDLKRHSNG